MIHVSYLCSCWLVICFSLLTPHHFPPLVMLMFVHTFNDLYLNFYSFLKNVCSTFANSLMSNVNHAHTVNLFLPAILQYFANWIRMSAKSGDNNCHLTFHNYVSILCSSWAAALQKYISEILNISFEGFSLWCVCVFVTSAPVKSTGHWVTLCHPNRGNVQ